jgi:hypothetical protein
MMYSAVVVVEVFSLGFDAPPSAESEEDEESFSEGVSVRSRVRRDQGD